MKDIDFDELDKAVSSVLSSRKSPKSKDAKAADADADERDTPSVTVDTTPVSPVEKSSDDSSVTDEVEDEKSPVDESVSEPTVAIKKPPVAQRRTGGRFMDVLHPSSDMSSSTKSSSPVSRQGVTIAPIAPESTAQTMPTASPATTSMQPIIEDFGGTPFLPDAKVDKRPLGGAPVPDAAVEQESSLASMPEISDAGSDAHLPVEFQGDLMAIEGEANVLDAAEEQIEKETVPAVEETDNKDDVVDPGASTVATAPTEPTAPTVPTTPDLPEEQPSVTTEPTSEKNDKKTKVVDIPAPEHLLDEPEHKLIEPHAETIASMGQAGLASISRQYAEQPSTGDQQNGAIFDTGVYHQPLAHPAKKKSGWSWVGWILLLLLVGGAGGAVVYLFSL